MCFGKQRPCDGVCPQTARSRNTLLDSRSLQRQQMGGPELPSGQAPGSLLLSIASESETKVK